MKSGKAFSQIAAAVALAACTLTSHAATVDVNMADGPVANPNGQLPPGGAPGVAPSGAAVTPAPLPASLPAGLALIVGLAAYSQVRRKRQCALN